jgi:hypothetical protein
MLDRLNIKYHIIDLFPTYNVDCIKVGFGKSINRKEIAKSLDLLERCFGLLKSFAPVRYNDIQRDIKKLYVVKNLIPTGGDNIEAMFIFKIKSIVLPIELLQSKIKYEYREEFIASNILHEAQHGRLRRLGFVADRKTLGRQERICYTVQRRFGSKICNGSEIIEYCDYALSVNLENYYSMESFVVRQLSNIENSDTPKWLREILIKKIVRAYIKKNNNNDNGIHPSIEKYSHFYV